ncbi:DUF4389 domain-containing protein [Marinicella sp. W31]|uniref:DUF4389 domain-containing protein n=1 Tax=Marinicella sp. W31 TaxID=3023713 RepID=UPI0037568956
MSEQKNENNETVEATVEETVNSTVEDKKSGFDSDVLIRIFMALLFSLIGWLTLWVFGAVVLIQAIFMIVTGEQNKNLKSFAGEIGKYLGSIVKYVSFQTDEKPFPFQSWDSEDKKEKPDENGQAA